MDRKTPEDRLAEQVTSYLFAGVFFIIAAFFQFLKERFSPTPSGIQVGHLCTPMGVVKPVGIPSHARCKHTWLVGSTGSGKTTVLKNLILQDMEAGHGLAVIDPKGDLIADLLPHIPAQRLNDLILFDPTDRNTPFGFNILGSVEERYRSRTASEVVSIFKKLFADSWGPRLEYILRATILTLLDLPGTTLLDIPTLLLDAEYRQSVLPQIRDFVVRAFWEQEFETLSNGQRMQAVMPILNKVGPWLAYPEIRNIVGQTHSSFNLREVINRRKILLAPLSQGLLGEDASNLLGAMLVSKIQLEAMTRVSQPAHERTEFFLYVDEFQNYVTSAFEKILTEARSFSLGLVVANQYPEQLSRDLILALEHNVAVRLTCYFENGYHRLLYQTPQDKQAPELIVQPLLPPIGGNPELPRQIRQTCRQRYGRPRAEVERAILERRGGRRINDHEHTQHRHNPLQRLPAATPSTIRTQRADHDNRFWQ